MFLGLQIQAHPHVYVKVRPVHHHVQVIRPACPAPGHMWVEGDWRWNPQINNYMWIDGRWIAPQPYSKWIPGHWKQTYEGYYWVPGHWKKLR